MCAKQQTQAVVPCKLAHTSSIHGRVRATSNQQLWATSSRGKKTRKRRKACTHKHTHAHTKAHTHTGFRFQRNATDAANLRSNKRAPAINERGSSEASHCWHKTQSSATQQTSPLKCHAQQPHTKKKLPSTQHTHMHASTHIDIRKTHLQAQPAVPLILAGEGKQARPRPTQIFCNGKQAMSNKAGRCMQAIQTRVGLRALTPCVCVCVCVSVSVCVCVCV